MSCMDGWIPLGTRFWEELTFFLTSLRASSALFFSCITAVCRFCIVSIRFFTCKNIWNAKKKIWFFVIFSWKFKTIIIEHGTERIIRFGLVNLQSFSWRSSNQAYVAVLVSTQSWTNIKRRVIPKNSLDSC